MACGGCGGGQPVPIFKSTIDAGKSIIKKIEPDNDKFKGTKPNGIFSNLVAAGANQNNKVAWFFDGVAGIAKCIAGKTIYSDQEIKDNRQSCKDCEFATGKDKDGNLTIRSQCMAIDPSTGAACGCVILCKTQSSHCPINKWIKTPITINGN